MDQTEGTEQIAGGAAGKAGKAVSLLLNVIKPCSNRTRRDVKAAAIES